MRLCARLLPRAQELQRPPLMPSSQASADSVAAATVHNAHYRPTCRMSRCKLHMSFSLQLCMQHASTCAGLAAKVLPPRVQDVGVEDAHLPHDAVADLLQAGLADGFLRRVEGLQGYREGGAQEYC